MSNLRTHVVAKAMRMAVAVSPRDRSIWRLPTPSRSGINVTSRPELSHRCRFGLRLAPLRLRVLARPPSTPNIVSAICLRRSARLAATPAPQRTSGTGAIALPEVPHFQRRLHKGSDCCLGSSQQPSPSRGVCKTGRVPLRCGEQQELGTAAFCTNSGSLAILADAPRLIREGANTLLT
jgi:hypothetical protein